ncbi:TPA: DNA-binding protein [Escherichia coli]|uniref:DNA-binding protein n=1 Tax=Escherichia coli TaxID=562 RepID=UPI000BE15626|nr:DNA-binding protein [Escherichia coli]EHD3401331.1 DNA-binding protein [Escherichia coli O152]EFL5695315.1 DNA-binding protein [Escherichia coli]EHD3448512.1 DNA-binding protein [Escherichia coli O152]HBD0331167.1 DNA-binding protein [Escherichia coli]HBD0336070.1 DNA-binding protein [Escherichia coli]
MFLKPMGGPGKAPKHVSAWTQQEDELLISLYQDHSTWQMAERLQRTRSAVMHRILFLRNRGLIGRKRKAPLSAEAIAFLTKNRHAKTARELARKAGCSECTVRYTLHKRGYSLKKCGESHHCTRYSDRLAELVTELRDRRNMTFCIIAKHINITMQMHISDDTAFHLYNRRTAADALLYELLPN